MMSSERDAGSGRDPLLRADGLQWVRLNPDEVVVRRGVAQVRLTAPGIADTLERLLELTDGSRTAEALVAAFPEQRHDDVRAVVAALQKRRMLAGDEYEDDAASAFWATVSPRSPDGRQRLQEAGVLVVGDGCVGSALARALLDCGVGRVGIAELEAGGQEHGPPGGTDGRDGRTPDPGGPERVDHVDPLEWDLTCAASDAGTPEAVFEVARAALRTRRLFLPVWIEDLVIHVGPLTHPYDTACLRCHQLRRRSNDTEWEVRALLERSAPGGWGAGFLPTMATVAGQVAATEVVKQLSGLPSSTTGRALELSLVPFRAGLHRVLRVPRCPECCGTAARGAPVLMHGSQMSG